MKTSADSPSAFNGYFDNGATSFPKPVQVAEEMTRYLNEIGGPYGRSFYNRAVEVSRIVETTRDMLADILNVEAAENIVFTPNATHAINIVLNGLDLNDSEVWISALEHNAILRPIHQLKKEKNIKVRFLPSDIDGRINIEQLKKMSGNPALIIINHQSNINGVIQPIAEIKSYFKNAKILIDGSQSVGHIPIYLDKWDIDFLAFTGHKSLLGPPGTGGLYVKSPHLLPALILGGTGSNSESSTMPVFAPDKYEAGTPNITGIFGLYGALNNKPKPAHSHQDFKNMISQIETIKNYHLYRANNPDDQGELFSLTHKYLDCAELGLELYTKAGIETRVGLHCSPLAHKKLGTFPNGTVRIAPSVYHRVEDFTKLVDTLNQIDKEYAARKEV